MSKTEGILNLINRNDHTGLRDRLAKIDHKRIIAEGRFWIQIGARLGREDVMITLTKAVEVTGLRRADIETLIKIGALKSTGLPYHEPMFLAKDLVAVVEDSARYKASKSN